MTAPHAATTGRIEARKLRAIAIGGSAGGIEALRVLLPALPSTLDVPVLITLHIARETRGDRWPLVFPECRLPIHEAEDKDLAAPGHVYIAPADYHLLVDGSGLLSLSTEERVHLSRPSIDVLLESAAWAYADRLLAIVLSGANADGAAGLLAARKLGGLCWVQSPDEAAAVAMPRAALGAVPDARVLTLADMASAFRSIEREAR